MGQENHERGTAPRPRRRTETVITWNTKKVAGGFQFRVYEFGYQVPTVELKVGVVSTRARASSRAKAWTRYFKAVAAKNAKAA